MSIEVKLALLTGAIIVVALVVLLGSRLSPKHFHASKQWQRVTGGDGNEWDELTFSAWRAHTLIGNTLGRACVAFAERRYARQEPKLRRV
jgi:hypothetical protein